MNRQEVVGGHTYDPNKVVCFDYLNYRNERAVRRVVPQYLWWGVTEWHPQEGWMLHALDLDRHDYRDFAFNHVIGPAREEIVKTTPITILDEAAQQVRMRKFQAAHEFMNWLTERGLHEAAREFTRSGLLDGVRP